MSKEIKRLEILNYSGLDFPDKLKNLLNNVEDGTERCNIIEDYYSKYAIVLDVDSEPDAVSNFEYDTMSKKSKQNKAMIIIRGKRKIYYANKGAFVITNVDTSRLWMEEEYDGTSSIVYFKIDPDTNQLIRDNK